MAAGDGLVTMTPTSIAYSGTSASINTDGGVDFSAVTSLSLNGVFTGGYDNYLIVIAGTSSASGDRIAIRLRSSGTDASGSNYTYQELDAFGASVTGARTSSTTSSRIGAIDDENMSGTNVHIYGAYLAQPTAGRGVSMMGQLGAQLHDYAFTHSLSTSYDGCTLFSVSTANMTGNVHVFGYEE